MTPEAIELTLCDNLGEVIVVGAMNKETMMCEYFCLPLHEEYDSWAKDLTDRGYILCRMTIDEMLASLDGENAIIH